METTKSVWRPYDTFCLSNRAGPNTGDQGMEVKGTIANAKVVRCTEISLQKSIFVVKKIFISLKIATHAEHD